MNITSTPPQQTTNLQPIKIKHKTPSSAWQHMSDEPVWDSLFRVTLKALHSKCIQQVHHFLLFKLLFALIPSACVQWKHLDWIFLSSCCMKEAAP